MYLSIAEAAGALAVATNTVYKAIAEGRLPASIGHGGLLVVKQSDVEQYAARTRPDGIKPKGRPGRARIAAAKEIPAG